MKEGLNFKRIGLTSSSGRYAGLVTLARPEDEGRLTAQDCRDLRRILSELGADSECVCAILTGSGECFCMGARVQPGLEGAQAFMEAFQSLFEAIEGFQKPLFSAVNGRTGGGGTALAAASSQVFAEMETPFSLPEILHGTCPGFAIQRLSGQLPRKVLFEMASSGRPKTAGELSRCGFCRIVPPGMDAVDAALKEAAALAPLHSGALQEIVAAVKRAT